MSHDRGLAFTNPRFDARERAGLEHRSVDTTCGRSDRVAVDLHLDEVMNRLERDGRRVERHLGFVERRSTTTRDQVLQPIELTALVDVIVASKHDHLVLLQQLGRLARVEAGVVSVRPARIGAVVHHDESMSDSGFVL